MVNIHLSIAFSYPLLNRTGGQNRLTKIMDSDKDEEDTGHLPLIVMDKTDSTWGKII